LACIKVTISLYNLKYVYLATRNIFPIRAHRNIVLTVATSDAPNVARPTDAMLECIKAPTVINTKNNAEPVIKNTLRRPKRTAIIGKGVV